jgi:putative Ca2+/H+ antiporter (TMEM165/GDT1 family)
MEAFVAAVALIAAAEIGDKSQLLALALAVRFRRPWPVAGGIALAALASHGLAGFLGSWVAANVPETLQARLVGAGFMLMALWVLLPDGHDEDAAKLPQRGGRSALLATALLFFVAELGDKTQVATLALAARFEAPLPVIAGAAIGMTAINLPVVWFGHRFAARLPVRPMRVMGAALFGLLGVGTLLWG